MKIKLSDLVLDFWLYPRSEINDQNVHYLCEAVQAGAILPPIIADQKSKRIVDGFHRYRCFARLLGEDGEVDAELRHYKSEKELFLDAVRLNAGHGRTLSTFDRVHCLLKAAELKITPEECATALSLTLETLGKLRTDRVGSLIARGPNSSIPLKRTIRHMAGRDLSMEQADANDKLSGMEQLFYVNQLILLFENDLLDDNNQQLMAGLARLSELITTKFMVAA